MKGSVQVNKESLHQSQHACLELQQVSSRSSSNPNICLNYKKTLYCSFNLHATEAQCEKHVEAQCYLYSTTPNAKINVDTGNPDTTLGMILHPVLLCLP